MHPNNELLKQTDIKDIADKGTAIYDSVKANYLPDQKGKYLAIDTESKDVYFAETSNEAVEKAKKEHPNSVFFVVKIGYSYSEALANYDEYAYGLHSR